VAEVRAVTEWAPWVPIFLFVILFGLSMDYEVFLLSKIREEYDRLGDNSLAVGRGLAATARVISAAAAIMVVVFLSFVLTSKSADGRTGPCLRGGVPGGSSPRKPAEPAPVWCEAAAGFAVYSRRERHGGRHAGFADLGPRHVRA
jgi:hypothetical protein